MNQFIVYRRSDKAPVDYRTGKLANAHDHSNWTDGATAAAVVQAWGTEWGIGFVLTEAIHIAVIDIDGCRNPESGEISDLAKVLITMLAGAYVEISISGRGLHIWFKYSGRMPPHASRAAGIGEFYHRDRYIAIGAPYEAPGFVNGSLAADLSASLPGLISTFFPPEGASSVDAEWTTEADPDWRGPEDDGELIRRAMQSRSSGSAFGNRASFSDLWLGNEQVLGGAYPDPNGRPYDASAADAALAQHLAFWTGRNAERIERLMRASHLVREKWDNHASYLPRTIVGAVSRQVDVLQDKPEAAPNAGGGLMLSREDRALLNVGTQDAIALLFRKQMAGKMLYDHTRGQWLEWDGTRWKLDRTGKAYNFIRDISASENHEHKAAMATASFCEGVEKHLKNDPAFARTRDQFDRDNYVLNTPTGTIDLRTGTIRAHEPSDMLTLCTGAAPSSYGGEEFLKVLSEITLGDAGLCEFLQVSLGACLSGATENHFMLFWIGSGRNGKNTLGDLVQDAMGDYAKKVPTSTLMAKSFESHPTEIANLQGVRLATSSEVNSSDHWDEARINDVTGDARLTGRFMRCDHFEFARTHKHLIYGNYKPQLRSVSDGIRSRIKIVPFNASFRGREDANLPSRLRENLGYVLSWLIEGHRQWIANNKRLPICPAVEAESEQYFEDQATPQRWLAERCELLERDDRPTEHLPKVT